MTMLLSVVAASLALFGTAAPSLADEFGEARWQGVVVAYNKTIWTAAPPAPGKGLVLTCIAAPCAGKDFVAVKPGQPAMGPSDPSAVPVYRRDQAEQ